MDGTNFILRIYKEQESNLILPEHDDDDDEIYKYTYNITVSIVDKISIHKLSKSSILSQLYW